MAKLAPGIKGKNGLDFDEYRRNIHLTDRGVGNGLKIPCAAGNIYEPKNIELLGAT